MLLAVIRSAVHKQAAKAAGQAAGKQAGKCQPLGCSLQWAEIR